MTKALPAVLVLFVMLFGCKKNQDIISPPVDEAVKGSVFLFDDEGEMFPNHSGLIVSVENSNPLISAVTDEKGRFQFPKWKATGPVTLVYTKEGFVIQRQYYNASQADSLTRGLIRPEQEILYQFSPVVVNSSIWAVKNDSLDIVVNVSFPGEDKIKYIRYFRQVNDPNVTATVANETRIGRDVSGAVKVKNGDNHFKCSLADFNICGKYTTGEIIYMKAYGDVSGPSYYTDPLTKKLIFDHTNPISKSAVISFTAK